MMMMMMTNKNKIIRFKNMKQQNIKSSRLIGWVLQQTNQFFYDNATSEP